MLFGTQIPADSPSRKQLRGSEAAAFALTLAATAAMMLCPCDVVGIHDYKAIALVLFAACCAGAAATFTYRRLSLKSEMTPFLRAVVAVAIVGIGVYVELLLAVQAVALMSRRR
jgi:hypothetical protein